MMIPICNCSDKVGVAFDQLFCISDPINLGGKALVLEIEAGFQQ